MVQIGSGCIAPRSGRNKNVFRTLFPISAIQKAIHPANGENKSGTGCIAFVSDDTGTDKAASSRSFVMILPAMRYTAYIM